MCHVALLLSKSEDPAARVYLVTQAEQQQLKQAAAEYLQMKRAADAPFAGE